MQHTVPDATRARGSSWRNPRLILGIAVVALSVLAGGWLMTSVDDTVGVWAVSRSLPAGAVPAAEDLEVRQVRFGDAELADRYLSADQEPPAGATLARDIAAGELLPRDAIAARESAPVTELPLSVANDDLPATVEVGSTVDVWVAPVTPSSGEADPAAELVLDDVRVVRLPGVDSTLGGAGTRQVIVTAPDRTNASDMGDAIGEIAAGRVILTRER